MLCKKSLKGNKDKNHFHPKQIFNQKQGERITKNKHILKTKEQYAFPY